MPLVPIALATGWSALVLFALRIPLNPMSVTLGALVIAISTEFSVLLSERYRQERMAGHEATEALRRTYRSTGAAVLASGVTAIAGFAVLIVSDIRMLRQFGEVTVVDLTVALLGVLVVLPAVLVLAERRAAGEPRRPAGLPRLPRLRRAPRGGLGAMSERGPLDFEHESDEEREARWAKRRDPDLDQPAGSPEHPVSQVPVPRPPGASRYGWFLGVVVVLLLALHRAQHAAHQGTGPRG